MGWLGSCGAEGGGQVEIRAIPPLTSDSGRNLVHLTTASTPKPLPFNA
ncbi:hypothetical protein [Actinokineospora terrae]|nr:hypothetical protein [Actinokineospora terrae]